MTTKIKSGVISDNAITSAHISSGAISSAHLTSIDTDNITEGSSNLYFTTARVDSHLSGGTGVTYSSGAISIGQSVATTDSPTFANLTLTGNLNITGDVDSVSVTDLDVTDKTITVGVGGTASANDGAGLVVDGASASILWNNSNSQFDINKGITVDGTSKFTITSGEYVDFYRSANANLKIALGSASAELSSAAQINIKPEGTSVSKYQLYSSTFYINGPSVGIGTSSPATLLDVSGTTPTITISDSQSKSWTSSDTIYGKVSFKTLDGSGIGAHESAYIGVHADVASSTTPAGRLVFGTSNSNAAAAETMTLDGNGYLGLGTSNPGYPLHVVSAETNHQIRVERTGTGNINLGVDTTGGFVEVQSSIPLRFYESNAERMRIDGGNVGIGESSPQTPLHISSDSASGENIALQIDNNNTTAGNEISMLFRSRVGTTNTDFKITGIANAANDMDLVFQSDGQTERMRIDSSGNVGINDTNPSQKLSVSGTSSVVPARFTAAGNTNTLEVFGNSTTDTSNGLLVSAGTSSNDYAAYFRKVDGTTPIMMIEGTGNVGIGTSSPAEALTVNGDIGIGGSGKLFNGTSSNSAGIYLPNSTVRIDGYNGITFHSSATTVGSQTERMRIDSSGNVGIGTSSPGNLLHIKKTGFTRGTFEADGDNQTGIQIKRSNSSNNTDWEIYSPSNSTQLRFYNGGDKVILDTAGRVHIGQYDSNHKGLTIYKSTNDSYSASSFNEESLLRLHVPNAEGNYAGITYTHAGGTEFFTGLVRVGATSDITDYVFQGYNGNSNTYQEYMRISSSGNVDLYTGRIKVTNSGTDAYFFEGVRSGGNVTLRMYDNNNNLYIDSYTNMAFRCNQTGGGSGGQIYFSGGDVNIGNSSDSARYLIFDKTASGENGIIFRNAASNKGKILLDSDESMQFYINNSTNAMTIRETKGQIDAAAVGGRFSGYVQDMVHIGADKSEVVRYGNSGKTYTDGGSSNYAGYVYGQENFLPGVFMPYSPNQVYRLSASIYQLTNGTGYDHSRHYIGVAGYDENFSFLSVDAIGTYQYNMASNTSLSAGNALEVDITIKGWQGSGGSNGNKMDEGTVYIRPLILFNYQRTGGTAVLTGFTMMPAGTISDNDSNAGTNY